MKMKKAWPYALVLLPWFAYVAITFLAARTGSVKLYGLDPRQLFYVRLTSILFNLFNWVAGCFCAVTCFAAAREVPDKRTAFRRMGLGSLALLIGAFVGANLAAARSLFIGDAHTTQALTVAVEEVFALAPLVGMSFIFSGSSRLAGSGKSEAVWFGWKAAGYTALTALASVNVWFVFSNPDRLAGNPAAVVPYFMPFSLVAVTILAPYLVTYALAMFTVFRSAKYFLNNGGAIFRSASAEFIMGLSFLMLWSLFQQITISIGPTRSAVLGLAGNLIVIYVYLIAQSCGYLFLGFSIRKISGIERLRHAYDKPADRDDAAMPPSSPLPAFRP